MPELWSSSGLSLERRPTQADRASLLRMPGRFATSRGQLRLHVHDPEALLKSGLRRVGQLRAPPDLLAA